LIAAARTCKSYSRSKGSGNLHDVAIFGGQGSGAIVADTLAVGGANTARFRLIGFLNDIVPAGERISGTAVIGPFSAWRDLPDTVLFVAPLHRATAMQERVEIIERLGIPPDRWATVIDPRSAVAADAVIGQGSFVGPFATIAPGARIGAHAVVRANACISHDCSLDDFTFVGSHAVICGYGSVGRGGYIAPNATVRDRCSIGRFACVGLGSVVAESVPDFVTVAGVPARPI
jgi:sugar O-acyltransferase (sialic acid O-acetyltransferase NeuD family)